jgi:class 3 adenylate cyclase
MGARSSGKGLATVVFVDVEGSTALLRRVGDEEGMGSVRRQLDVVRQRIESYGGAEVKSLGDGLLVTFASPRQAVAFAVASQRALAGSALQVRFGINTGEVIDVDVDPLGGAVNAAARIAGRAACGEVLVSDVVRHWSGQPRRSGSPIGDAAASRGSPNGGTCGRPRTAPSSSVHRRRSGGWPSWH